MSQYVLAIIKDKNKLQDRCNEVNIRVPSIMAEVTKVINDLKETLRANINLLALSAPQIGYKGRVFCIRFANGDIRAFVNPMIVVTSKKMHLSREKCPSVSDTEYIIPRYDDIEVAYQTPVGNNEENKFLGAPSEVFQQMMNLIDGVLIDDIGLEVLPGFDEATDDEREQIISMYIDSLKTKTDVYTKEVESNPDLKKTNDAIKFMTDVALGKVEYRKLTKEEADSIKKQQEKDNTVKQ
jgi:peptide deformylase